MKQSKGEQIKIYVWEPPVRLFHWTLVATVLFSWVALVEVLR